MLSILLIRTVALTSVFGCFATPRVDPLVRTKVGLIRGLKADDGNYSMFMGIPFGNIDRANPFGPSEPYPEFEEIFEAFDDSAKCPQIEEFNNTVVGTLDCLRLHVYVPSSASSNNLLPVMVWIYGGGFTIGFAGRYVYGPKFIVRHDVILVTINYRLGPYGFMCLDTPEYPGNQGMKDQLLALKWIKENIESFGGNADEITIFGESAGGISVDLHIRFNKEKLFNKAIMESGTALEPGMKKVSNQNTILQLAAVLGFKTEDYSQAVSFLSTVDPHLVIAATSELNPSGTFIYNTVVLCVEKDFDDVDAFITVNPSRQDNISLNKDIKILIGYNSDEMSTYRYYADDPNIFTELLKLDFDFDEEKIDEMARIIKHFYMGDKDYNVEDVTSTLDFVSDYVFNHPTQRSIRSYLQNGVQEIYHYVFSYVGGRNMAKRNRNNTIGGASHTDELGYLFDVSFWTEELEPGDQLIVDRMTTMWANFAKYGDPTPMVTELLPVKWEPITPNSSIFYLDIDSDISLQTSPFSQRLTFWDLFYKANQRFYKDL